MQRRSFVSSLAAAGLTGCAHRVKAPAIPQLMPIRAQTDRIFRITVCVRPFRAAGPRLDVERVAATIAADTLAPVTAIEGAVRPSGAPVVVVPMSEPTHWKMRIQIEAADHMKTLRGSGANPTVHSILNRMATWCRDNDVKTDGNIFPGANYLRTHVLGVPHWKPPR